MHGIHPVIYAGDKAIAYVAVFGDANAHLIAAAPDLLAALKELKDGSALGMGTRWVRTCEAAEAAITKAEGGAA